MHPKKINGWLPRALSYFNKRDYWKRAWIVQEIILAKEFTIYCGTKTIDGFRIFLMGCYDFVIENRRDSNLSGFFLHRENLRRGEPETLERLLIRYSQTDCQDPRDRVFSLLTLATDCHHIEKAFVDYSVDAATMFFALLALLKPNDIINTVITLQNVLRVTTDQLVKFWLTVDSQNECPKSTRPMEELALSFIWGAKNMMNSPEFDSWKASTHAKQLASRRNFKSASDIEWLMRCCLYAHSPTNPEDYMIVEFESLDFCLLGQTSLFGLIFDSVHRIGHDRAPSTSADAGEEQGTADSKEEKPTAQIYHRTLEDHLSEEPSVLVGSILEAYESGLKQNFGKYEALTLALMLDSVVGGKVKLPVDLCCSYLMEKKKRSPSVFCMTECRREVELFGHKLLAARGDRNRDIEPWV